MDKHAIELTLSLTSVCPQSFSCGWHMDTRSLVMTSSFSMQRTHCNRSSPRSSPTGSSIQFLFVCSVLRGPLAITEHGLSSVRHLPTWFPGASFHTKAAEIRDIWYRAHYLPHKWVKDQLVRGCIALIPASQMLNNVSVGCRNGKAFIRSRPPDRFCTQARG